MKYKIIVNDEIKDILTDHLAYMTSNLLNRKGKYHKDGTHDISNNKYAIANRTSNSFVTLCINKRNQHIYHNWLVSTGLFSIYTDICECDHRASHHAVRIGDVISKTAEVKRDLNKDDVNAALKLSLYRTVRDIQENLK